MYVIPLFGTRNPPLGRSDRDIIQIGEHPEGLYFRIKLFSERDSNMSKRVLFQKAAAAVKLDRGPR